MEVTFEEAKPEVAMKWKKNFSHISSYSSLDDRRTKPSTTLQRPFLVICYLIELLPAFAVGSQLTYGTIAIAAHQKRDAAIYLDKDTGSWLVSLLSIFIVLGSLFSSLLSSLTGRRWALFLSCNCINLGLAFLYFAPSYHYLLAGRILCGLGSGLGLPTSYLFIHETSLPQHRSTMAALNIFSLNSGNLYSLVVGWVFPYRWMPLIVAIPSVLFCMCAFKLLESAVYLIQNAKEVEAKDNLMTLWKDKQLVLVEMEWLNDHLQSHASTQSCFKTLKDKMTWANVKAIIHVSVLMLSQSFSGCDTIYNYSLIIAKMANLKINENLLSVLLQTGFNFGFIISPLIIKYFSRKSHYVISAVLLAISLSFLGLGLSQDQLDYQFSSDSYVLFQFLPVASVLGYAFIYGCGVGSLPFTLLGEILPDVVRNFGNSVATFFRYSSVFLLLKMFPQMSDTIGLNGLFWFHAICCLLCALYVQIFVPETKNCVNMEIGDGLDEDDDEEFCRI